MAKHLAIEEATEIFGEFVERALLNDKDVFMGIDPGATGAIAVICGRNYAVVPIPVVVLPVKRSRKIRYGKKEFPNGPPPGAKKTKTIEGTTTEYDHASILGLFRMLRPVKDRVYAMIEIGLPSIGGKGGGLWNAYKVGVNYGTWPLFLKSRGYAAVSAAHPVSWKKAMKLSKDKEASRRTALNLFPKAPLNHKNDHDKAEALLLAEYFRRVRAGKA